jgi:hypothetical protein
MAPFNAGKIHAVRHDRDLVLLDATRGAYHCLADAGRAVQRRSATGELVIEDRHLARLLREANLLAPNGRLAGPGSLIPRAGRDLSDLSPSPLRWRDGPDFAAFLAGLAPNYYGRSFAHLIADARRHAHLDIPPDLTGPLLAAVALFQRWAPWAPFQGECLYRSYALLRWLRRRRLRAHWVFGVQTWPFAAHCWLQVGDVALDDVADNTAAYSPILIV